MASRRALLRAFAVLAASGTATTATATGQRPTPRADASFDPGATVDALRALGGPAVGRVDLAAVRHLRRDRRTATGQPMPRVPGGDRAGPTHARSVLRRLRSTTKVRAHGGAGGVYEVASAHGRAELGRQGDLLSAVVPRAGTVGGGAADLVGGSPAGSSDLGRLAAAFADADGFVAVPVEGGAGDLRALGLGVALGADREFRARFVGLADPDRALAVLDEVGVPLSALADLAAARDGDVLTVRAAVDRQSQVGGSLLLWLLLAVLAVLGTFVLGLGSQVEPSAPQVSLQYAYDRDSGRVTITHYGGDELGTDGEVIVRYTHEGEDVFERWRESDGIQAGDSYTTRRAPDPGTEVLVVWQGEGNATLGTYPVPE